MRIACAHGSCRPMVFTGVDFGRQVASPRFVVILFVCVLLLTVVCVPRVDADTTYHVHYAWTTGEAPLPAPGSADFMITFDPSANASGVADVQSLGGFNSYNTFGSFTYDYHQSGGDDRVLTLNADSNDPAGLLYCYGYNFPTLTGLVVMLLDTQGQHYATGSITASATVVPLPGAALLLGAGLLRLVAYRRRKLSTS